MKTFLYKLWIVWFTVSILSFIITSLIELCNPNTFDLGITILLAFHVITSTVVGVVTYEDKQ